MDKAHTRRRIKREDYGEKIKALQLDSDGFDLAFQYTERKNRCDNCLCLIASVILLTIFVFLLYCLIAGDDKRVSLPADRDGYICGLNYNGKDMESKEYLFISPIPLDDKTLNAWCVKECCNNYDLLDEILEDTKSFCKSDKPTCACTGFQPKEIENENMCGFNLFTNETIDYRKSGCIIIRGSYNLSLEMLNSKVCYFPDFDVKFSPDYTQSVVMPDLSNDMWTYPSVFAVVIVVTILSFCLTCCCTNFVIWTAIIVSLLGIIVVDVFVLVALIMMSIHLSGAAFAWVIVFIFGLIGFTIFIIYTIYSLFGKKKDREKIGHSIELIKSIVKFWNNNCCMTLIPILITLLEMGLMLGLLYTGIAYYGTRQFTVDPHDLHKDYGSKATDYLIYIYIFAMIYLVQFLLCTLSKIVVAASTSNLYFSRSATTPDHAPHKSKSQWQVVVCGGLWYTVRNLTGTALLAGAIDFVMSKLSAVAMDRLMTDGTEDPGESSSKKVFFALRKPIAFVVNKIFDLTEIFASPGSYVMQVVEDNSYVNGSVKARNLRYRHVSSGMAFPDIKKLPTKYLGYFTLLVVAFLAYFCFETQDYQDGSSITSKADIVKAAPLVTYTDSNINVPFLISFVVTMYMCYSIIGNFMDILQVKMDCLYICYLIDMELAQTNAGSHVSYTCKKWREMMERIRVLGEEGLVEDAKEEEVQMPDHAMSYMVELYDNGLFDQALLRRSTSISSSASTSVSTLPAYGGGDGGGGDKILYSGGLMRETSSKAEEGSLSHSVVLYNAD